MSESWLFLNRDSMVAGITSDHVIWNMNKQVDEIFSQINSRCVSDPFCLCQVTEVTWTVVLGQLSMPCFRRGWCTTIFKELWHGISPSKKFYPELNHFSSNCSFWEDVCWHGEGSAAEGHRNAKLSGDLSLS